MAYRIAATRRREASVSRRRNCRRIWQFRFSDTWMLISANEVARPVRDLLSVSAAPVGPRKDLAPELSPECAPVGDCVGSLSQNWYEVVLSAERAKIGF